MRSDGLERSRVDAAGAVAQETPDLAGQEPPQVGVGQGRELADRLDACRAQPRLRARADPGERADVERREERRLASGRDDGEPAGLAAVARDLRDDLRGRDAERALRLVAPRTEVCTASATARASPNVAARPRRGRGSPRRGPCARPSARPRARPPRPRASTRGRAVARPDENRLRAPAQRLGAAHRRADPEPARVVVGRRDDAAAVRIAADDQRLRAQLGSSSSSTAAKNASRSRCARITGQKLTDRARPCNSLLRRVQAVDDPVVAGSAVADSVVQTVVAVLPELVGLGVEPIAAPMRGTGEFLWMGGVELGEAPVELLATRSARSVSRPRLRSGSRAASPPSRCPTRRARAAGRSLPPALDDRVCE